MRSNFLNIFSRGVLLACGLAIFASACGGGGGGGGTGGAKADAGSGGKADAGAGGAGGTKADAGAGGAAGAKADAGAGGSDGAATTDGGAGGRVDGGAGAAGTGGAGATGTGGAAGTAGNNLPLGLPWRAFLPLGAAAPGSGVAMGTTSDLSINHFDATYLGNTVTFANASLNLTGAGNASELVSIAPKSSGARPVDVTGSYSISVWTKLVDTGGFRTVVSGEGFSVASFYLQKRGDTNAFAYTALASDSAASANCVVPSGPAPDAGPAPIFVTPMPNVQYHLVATRDAVSNLAILYVNGVESGRGTCPPGWADTGIVGIGHGIFAGARGDYVQGSIAELGLIDRVLTPTEVANLYAAGRAGMGQPDAGVDGGSDASDAGAVDAPADSPAATDGGGVDGG
jgi:hypothetical protein